MLKDLDYQLELEVQSRMFLESVGTVEVNNVRADPAESTASRKALFQLLGIGVNNDSSSVTQYMINRALFDAETCLDNPGLVSLQRAAYLLLLEPSYANKRYDDFARTKEQEIHISFDEARRLAALRIELALKHLDSHYEG